MTRWRYEYSVGLAIVGSTPTQAMLRNNLRQVVHTLVPLSSSSINWYCCKKKAGRVTAGDGIGVVYRL